MLRTQSRSSRLPALLSTASLIAAIALPIWAVALWVFWDPISAAAAAGAQLPYDPSAVGLSGRVAGCLVWLLGAAIQAYGLLGLRRTFAEAQAGRPLSSLSLKGFQRFAWASVASAAYGVAQHTALILILSVSDPATPGAVSIQFGSHQAQALFIGLLMVFVAEVFAEGKRAADETAAFI
ncbi:MAG: hypothetical protein AAF527_12620 [Pseudomonadota bacterium]